MMKLIRSLSVGLMLLIAFSSYGRGRDAANIADSLIKKATAEYHSSFPEALRLATSALQLSTASRYSKGVVDATCLTAIVWSNTSRCREAINALQALPAAYPSADTNSVYAALGICWFNHGNYDSALRYHAQVIDALQQTDPQGTKYAYECLAMGRTYVKLGINTLALEYYEKAIRAMEHEGNKSGVAWAADLLGEIYYAQRLYDRAMAHLRQSRRTFQALHEADGEASALLHAGNVWYMQVKDDSALYCYNTALESFARLGDSAGMAICYSNLSRIALEARNTTQAINYAQKALNTIRPGNYMGVEAGTYQQLGDIYGELKQDAVAAAYVEKALAAARVGNNKVVVKDCYKSLSELYQSMHKPEQALMYLLTAYRMKDTIEPISFGRQLAEMDAKYKAEKKEAEIKDLKQQGLINRLKVEQQRDRLQLQGFLLLLLLVVIVAAVAVTYFRRSKRLLLEQIKRENLIRETEERERMRISKDIHDELGSGLSRILYLSEERQIIVTPERQPQQLNHITETARGLIGNMKDLVWAMNPDNTTLSSLAARIREYSSEYLEDMPIALTMDIPNDLPERAISKEATRNLFMIIKEALQNIVKYADAQNVVVLMQVAETFRLEISDDGRGFDMQHHKPGNGLRNIRLRAEALGARATMTSIPGNGTKIVVEMQVAAMNTKGTASNN